jgi:polyhydroxybutyrate depolymerase
MVGLFVLFVLAMIALAAEGMWLGVLASVGRGTSDASQSVVINGFTRHYLLHVPANLPVGRHVPLVLVFHGGGGRAARMPGFTGFDDLADRELFIVAYLDGVGRHWNDGRDRSTADDIGFVSALLDEVERAYPVDKQRIYATGISNGGFFSNRLACELSDRISAIASVAATMPEPLAQTCKPARPVSVLYIQGTDDPLVPIDGGKIGFRRGRSLGRNISLAESAEFWRKVDGIRAAPEVESLPDRVEDGTHVSREVWPGGRDDTEVVVYTIAGGGHAWPGGPQYLPKFIVGRASRNLDATRAIWDFFERHSLSSINTD